MPMSDQSCGKVCKGSSRLRIYRDIILFGSVPMRSGSSVLLVCHTKNMPHDVGQRNKEKKEERRKKKEERRLQPYKRL